MATAGNFTVVEEPTTFEVVEEPDTEEPVAEDRDADGARLGTVILDVASQFGAGVNDTLATFLGLPGDAVNFVFRRLGVPEEFRSFATSENLVQGLDEVGLIREPTTGAGRFSRRVGEEVGAAVIPAAGIAGAAARTARLAVPSASRARNILEPILNFARQAPARSAASELGLAVSGGGLGFLGREVGKGVGAPTTGEIMGQIAGSFAPAGAFSAVRGIRSFGRGITRAGRERVVTDFVAGKAASPDRAFDALHAAGRGETSTLPGASLTPAQITGDPGLLSLERAVIKSSAEITGQFEDAAALTNQAMRRELQSALGGGGATGEDAARFFAARIERLKDLLDERTLIAARKAQQRIDAIRQDVRDEATLARVVREELDRAFLDARAQERRIWSAVPDDVQVSLQPVRDRLAEIRAAARKADSPENIPSFVRELLEGKSATLGNVEDVGEVLALRSRFLDEIRAENAAAAPNRRLVANLEKLQDSVMESLGAVEGQVADDVVGSVRAANDFSRALNDRFTRGPVGRLLRFDTAGGKVAPELTLQRILRPDIEGGVNTRALVNALGENADVDRALRETVRQRFFEQAFDANRNLDPSAARRFIGKHKAVLDNLPGLRDEFTDATEAQKIADRFRRSGDRLSKNVTSTAKSRAALFLDNEPRQAMQKALNSSRPRRTMQQLVKQAAKDESGQALRGLRQLFVEELLGRVSMQSRIDVFDNPRISASRLRKFTEHPKVEAAMSALYEPEQLRRLRTVVETATRAARSGAGTTIGGSDTAPNINILLAISARLVGARGGAFVGGPTGASILSAGVGARVAQFVTGAASLREMHQLVANAVIDPKVMQTMLMRPTRETEQIIKKRLRGHLLNIGVVAGEEEAAPQQGGPQ